MLAEKVFSQNNDTTESGFLQAIQYAVQNGAKVINESFGSNNFPDTALDVTREADDAAVAAGVTVVVSSGDAGNTNTIGSPATDPNLISVGATTTFRAYAQANSGGLRQPRRRQRSLGRQQHFGAVLGWVQSGRQHRQPGGARGLQLGSVLHQSIAIPRTVPTSSGALTSASSNPAVPASRPRLTSAAAADVIQAYAQAHGGTDPSPALVKQILVSTATDIDAPADQQGAGLLDIGAAVNLAKSIPGQASRHGPDHSNGGGLLVNPSQVNFVGQPGTPESQQISLTNTGMSPERVDLSTRALTNQVSDSGVQTFTMDPSNPTTNSGTMPIWSGVTEVYQTETFNVPRTDPRSPSRLLFSADYQFTGQGSVLHVALFEPDGTYAAYSEPQGLGDFAETEVTNPVPGRWTALFFTEQDGATGPGSSGTRGASSGMPKPGSTSRPGSITPSGLVIPPGRTATATLSLTTPAAAGDTDQSIVVSSADGQTSIPVTVRSVVPMRPEWRHLQRGAHRGQRAAAGSEAQTNSYYFNVPPGQTDLDASIALANNPSAGLVQGDFLLAYLVDPNGQTVGYSSDVTLEPTSAGLEPATSLYTQVYHVAPIPGQWKLVLYWFNPVVGRRAQRRVHRVGPVQPGEGQKQSARLLVCQRAGADVDRFQRPG